VRHARRADPRVGVRLRPCDAATRRTGAANAINRATPFVLRIRGAPCLFQLPAVRFATRREPTTRAPAEACPPRHLEIDNHARGVDTSGRRPHRGKCGLADAAHTMGALTTRRPTKPQRNYDSPATCKRSGSCPLVDGSLGAFLYLPL
jgi:hypothetical protein